MLQYYKHLIHLRKQYPVMVHGDFIDCLPEDPDRYAYLRTLNGERLFVLLNFKDHPVEAFLPEGMDPTGWELLNLQLPRCV